MSQVNQQRRAFFKQMGVAAAGAFVIPALSSVAARAGESRGGKASATKEIDLPLVSPKEDAAKAVNYVENKADMKKAELKVERQGVKWDDQHCSGCGFFKAVGKKDGKEVGTCTLFNKKLVVAPGWCGTWNKKS